MSKLGLGTAQWGLPYGISNRSGQSAPEEIRSILAEARAKGIRILDTASFYGEAEAVLGRNSLEDFRIISKTPVFSSSEITQEHAAKVKSVFDESLHRLSCNNIYGLLIHSADDLLSSGGYRLVGAMEDIRDRGLVGKIGVSVYDGRQIDAVLKLFRPDIVQLPLSVIDQRLLLSGHLNELKCRGVEIHVRSVFLQGLLLMMPGEVPPYFDPIRGLLAKWHAAAESQGMTLVQAALSYVRDLPHIDTVLVGIENLAQFQSCAMDFSAGRKFDASGLGCNESAFVNPALWKGV